MTIGIALSCSVIPAQAKQNQGEEIIGIVSDTLAFSMNPINFLQAHKEKVGEFCEQFRTYKFPTKTEYKVHYLHLEKDSTYTTKANNEDQAVYSLVCMIEETGKLDFEKFEIGTVELLR